MRSLPCRKLVAIGAALAAAAVAASVPGCSAGTRSPDASLESGTRLPALPAALAERAVTAGGINQVGSQAVEQCSGASADGDVLTVPGDRPYPGYAIWSIDAAQYEVSSYQVAFSAGPGVGVWLGISNYHTGSWDLSGPYSSGAPAVICTGSDYTSPAKRAYILVVADGPGSASVSQVALGQSIVLPTASGNLMWDKARAQALALSQEQQYTSLVSLVRQAGDYYRGFDPPETGTWWQPHQNGCMALGVAWRLTGNEKYRTELIEYLNHVSNYADLRGGRDGAEDLDLGVSLTNISVCTNWLRDDLDPAVLAKLHALLFREAQYAEELFSARRTRYFWNHAHFVATGLYAAACELDDFTPEAASWRTEVETFYEQMEDLLDETGSAYYPEGCAYASAVYLLTAQYRELRRSFSGSVPPHTWWSHLDDYFGCTLRPNMLQTLRLADDDGVWIYLPCGALRYAAAAQADPLCQSLARHMQLNTMAERETFAQLIWQSAVFTDPRVSTAALSLDAKQEFADAGVYIRRSGWAADANLLQVRSGLPGGAVYNAYLSAHPADGNGGLGHLQADISSFSWFVGGSSLLSDCGFEDRKYTNQHNTVTFSGRGQMGEAGEWWGWGWDWKPWGYGGQIDRITDSAADYTVLNLRADTAYVPAAAVQQFRRRIIWFAPNVLVVQDKVVISEAKNIECNWLTELGPWSINGSVASAGGRLNMRVIGAQPATKAKKELSISSKVEAQRLQTIYLGQAGESDLVHIFWDSSSDEAWSLFSAGSDKLVFHGPAGSLELTRSSDLLKVSGYRALEFHWSSI